MTSKEIREKFLRYFESNGHRRVRSSPVVPQDDPTLLFTNAGMNQFKNIFLGKERRDYKRAMSTQKCIRASGKHNDLEDVGKDTYHHTFFEMLGNWSFGDYYKKEAIEFAWEFLTEDMGLPKENLWATVYLDDDEAEELWRKVTDIDPGKIRRFKKDNFWEVGDVGPCGPCSEIHFDMGPDYGCGRADCGPNCPHCESLHLARYMEFWNLVFIQFNRDESGALEELPEKHVDTGLGFERIVAIIQGVDSDYDTDLFRPIISEIEGITGRSYEDGSEAEQVAFRVIADHIRALTFAITDGALPSNEGCGYVLRRILRRGARFGRTLGMHEPFIYKLTSPVVDVMGEAYPEIVEKCNHVSLVVKVEEEGFGKTLDRGIEKFEQVAEEVSKSGGRVISGTDAFRLYDTYGFPLDLTQLMAEEKGLSVDVSGFEREMEVQRERARSTARFVEQVGEVEGWEVLSKEEHSKFIGYEEIGAESQVVRYRGSDDKLDIILNVTPFYGEAGGQVGDVGEIRGDRVRIQISDTIWTDDGILHRGRILQGSIEDLRGTLWARVDVKHRLSTARNHTATHLLQAALRQILGDHVHQSGSLVAPDRLRFDFTHFASIEPGELERIEDLVNEKIRENIPVHTIEATLEEAQAMGAIALFGEKYGDRVRVIQIGDYSLEVCGGTHVKATGEIGQFRLLSEGGISAGVRRIEALTGEAADELVRRDRKALLEVGRILNVPVSEVTERVESLTVRNRELEKELEGLRREMSGSEVDELIRNAALLDGLKVVSARVETPDMEALRGLADSLRERLGTGVGVLGTVFDEKVSFIAVVTDNLIKTRGLKAGDIVREVAKIVGGGGGGRPHMAQAGGRNPEKLDEALGKVVEIVEGQLKGKKFRGDQ